MVDILQGKSLDELWDLHEHLSELLSERIVEEKAKLERRLRSLVGSDVAHLERTRRPYPPVHAKYRNPKNPAQTWAGRGKQPQWVRAELGSGKSLDELRIKNERSVGF